MFIHKNTLAGMFLREGEAGEGSSNGGAGANPMFLDPQTLALKPAWQEALPEDMRPFAANFTSLPDLVKSALSSKQALSKATEGRVKIPTETSSDEEKKAYLQAMGIPDDPKGYEFKAPDAKPTLKGFFEKSTKDIEEFSTIAHKLGVPKSQASQLMEWWAEKAVGNEEASNTAIQAELANWEKELKTTWGEKYASNLQTAKAVAATIGGIDPEVLDIYPPAFTLFLANLSNSGAVKSGTLLNKEQFGNGVNGPDLAKDIQVNPSNPDHKAWMDTNDPRHAEVKKRVLALNGLK